jgi:diguanylate cyclase (GGDEF)-like protein
MPIMTDYDEETHSPNRGLGTLMSQTARALGVPVALLSRDQDGWRFEAEAFPPQTGSLRFHIPPSGRHAGDVDEMTDASGARWTGMHAGTVAQREWLLMLPGAAEQWNDAPGVAEILSRFSEQLCREVAHDEYTQLAAFQRRLFAFVRRLSRVTAPQERHNFILRAFAREVHAATASFALYNEPEGTLSVTATRGYPLAIVDHVRIAPGEGIIGEVFSSGRAVIGQVDVRDRRLRYRSDSYLAVPLISSGRTLAVVSLTDRTDGRAFAARDLAFARMFAPAPALALANERTSGMVQELNRAATVDSVTGVFNRRYFQVRIREEVQRAHRQSQDLALLMVDIDDFKRINDTLGHIEGDRALRDVADTLHRGVRIFDLCARYGGEEFAIVMPGASKIVALQVAERIRQAIAERPVLTSLRMTVSVGVGLLSPGQTEDDLIAAADRALIAAKRGGKNMVQIQE